ncbi:hypothetical protein ACSQ67_024655 [Phaseolus vulgaris]
MEGRTLRRSGSVRFAAFTTSYKNFKERYFKIFVEPDGREYFYNDDVTKFPFHWTQNPTVLNTSSRTALSALDKAVMVVFDQLPHKLPTREIISLYASSDPRADFIEIMSRADVSLHEYMNKLRRSRDGRSASVDTSGRWRPFRLQRFLRRGPRAAAKKRVGPEGKSGGPSRAIPNDFESTAVAVGMDIAAHCKRS